MTGRRSLSEKQKARKTGFRSATMASRLGTRSICPLSERQSCPPVVEDLGRDDRGLAVITIIVPALLVARSCVFDGARRSSGKNHHQNDRACEYRSEIAFSDKIRLPCA